MKPSDIRDLNRDNIEDSAEVRKEVKRMRQDSLKDPKRTNLYNRINRYGYREFNGVRHTKEYVFFTKPDLNILDSSGSTLNPELASEPFFQEMFTNNKRMLLQLQSSASSETSTPFMFLLSNKLRNRVDVPSISSEDVETSSTQYGSRIYTKKHSYGSGDNHEFSLDFEDSKDLEVYNLFKTWDEYSNLKAIGRITPLAKYRDNKEMHDQISIYKFIVDETNMNILFYAKLTGCYPKGVPRDHFSDEFDTMLYSIPFKANFVEDSNPVIIEEFNMISSIGRDEHYELPMMTYLNEGGVAKVPNMMWARSAYIERQEYLSKEGYRYILKWRG